MEKRIVDYIIKADSDPAKLARAVSDMLKQDYEPYGNLCENGGGTVWQVMVKYGQQETRSAPAPMYKGTEIV